MIRPSMYTTTFDMLDTFKELWPHYEWTEEQFVDNAVVRMTAGDYTYELIEDDEWPTKWHSVVTIEGHDTVILADAKSPEFAMHDLIVRYVLDRMDEMLLAITDNKIQP